MSPINLERAVLELATDSAKFNSELDQAQKRVAGLEAKFDDAKRKMAGFQDGLDKSHQKTSLFSGGLEKLGAALSIAAIGVAIKKFSDYSGQVADTAAKLGITTTEVQKLSYAAKMGGSSIEAMGGGVVKLGKALVEGDKSTVKALGTMGLKLDEVRKLDPAKAFTTVADAIAKIQNPAEQATLAIALFGKSGADLLPAFKGNLTEAGDAAERLGLILSEKTIAAGDKLGDTLDTVMLAGVALTGRALEPMIDAFEVLAGAMVASRKESEGFIGPLAVAAETTADKLSVGTKIALAAIEVWALLNDQLAQYLVQQAAVMAAMAEAANLTPGGTGTARLLNAGAASVLKLAADAQAKATQIHRDAIKAGLDAIKRFEDAAADATKRHTKAVAGLAGKYGEASKAAQIAIGAQIDWQTWIEKIAIDKRLMYETAANAAGGGQFAEGLPRLPFFTRMEMVPLNLTNMTEMFGEGAQKTLDWSDAIEGLASQFQRLGSVVGSGQFQSNLQDLANIIGGVEMGGAASKGFRSAFMEGSTGKAIAGMAGSALQGIMAMGQATSSKSMAKNVLGGAATGAQMGMIAGPIGAGIGAGVGALVGYLRSRGAGDKSANAALDEQRKALLGTYGSVENIAKLGKQLGVDLAGAWNAKGQAGLTTFNDLLAKFNEGLTKNQELIAGLAALKPGETLSKALRAQMASGILTDEARAAIGSFITGQTSLLADTVKAYVEGGGSLTGASGRLAFASGTAAIGQMQAQGMSIADIAATLGPTLGTISGGTGMSNPLIDMLNQASRPEISAVLKSSDQQRVMGATLQNLGLMNKDTFGDLTAGLTESYDKLVSEGVQGDQAQAMLKANMQQAWEMIKDYGYVADEATQSMLSQAEANGIIGEAYRSSEDQLKSSIDKLIESNTDLAAALRGQVAPPSGGGATGVPDAGYGDGDERKRYHLGGFVSRAHAGASYAYDLAHLARAHGGLFVGRAALAASEVPLIAQDGEGILSRAGMRTGEQLLNELNAGRLPGGGGDGMLLPLNVYAEGEPMIRAIVKVRKRKGWGG